MNVLTIAGTDPSGGAGIQVDLQVIRDHHMHGLSAVTAVVWQNTQGVQGFRVLQPVELRAQIDAVLNDFEVAAIKIGMVGSASNALAIHDALDGFGGSVVYDPVLTSGDGETSLWTDGLDAARRLAARATLVTPNLPEAVALFGHPEPQPDVLVTALAALLGTSVLLKAGHMTAQAEGLRDLWCERDHPMWLPPTPRVDADVRGTGCQLSTAIACGLAAGMGNLTAVAAARQYLSHALTRRENRGRGRPIVVRTDA